MPVPGSPGTFINETLSLPVTATRYNDTDGGTGCSGLFYEYVVLTTPPSWPVTIDGDTYTLADNKRFWDWTYHGFGGGGSQIWTEYCHGYAFGVGDWPSSSASILANHGIGVQCWIPNNETAAIASTFGHSVKIVMEHCPSRGYIVKSSSEKFRESAIYTLDGNCDTLGIDLKLGNGDHRYNLAFTLFKEN